MNNSCSKLHDECGVFGIYGDDIIKPSVASYYGLFALQHRGQESCGIAVSEMGVLNSYKNKGLVSEVFDDKKLKSLNGQIAIGHVRYSTAGQSSIENSQPFLVRHSKGRLAISHNGNLTNAEVLRKELAQEGAMFQTTTDAEVITQIIARERVKCESMEDAVLRTMKRLKGAYSLLVLSPRKLIAVRDPLGFRPLVIGKLGKSFVAASETCALDAVGAEVIRDVKPGEVIVFNSNGMKSICDNCSNNKRTCIFEYIYFARPDSVIDSVEVHASRIKAGRILAKQCPADAEIVIGVPDSGLDAAIGYARESGIEYSVGFVRNNYVGRTFIKPEQSQRREGVDIKLNILSQNIKGKRIVMVDDSIVRGSTSANIIKALKKAGAKQVHVRISSPTLHWPCYYGTDIPTRDELASNRNSVEQLCEKIGADSLGFLSVESLKELVNSDTKTYCDACFTGDYPER